MRKLCGVAPRLSSVMKNSLSQLLPNHGSCRSIVQHADSPKRTRKVQLRGLSENVTKAIEAITASKAANGVRGRTLYLMDSEAAKKFAAMIIADCRAKVPYVAEINSGLGFLTKELLEAGIPSIRMFEGVPYLIPNLISIVDKYPGRAVLRPLDFQHVWSIGYVDWKENSDKLTRYFNDIEKRAWEDEPAVQIIGVLGDMNFIRRLTSTVVFQNTFSRFGRMVLHVALPPSVWSHLTCTNDHYDLYRCHSILFQTLFDYKLLGTLPRKVFYPHYRRPASKKGQPKCRVRISQNDGRLMNVVRIEPKADLFKDDFTLSDIVPFYYFVHHHLKSRRNRVIPALEKWVPGCGRNLIAKGFNIYTEFGELTPQEIMNLFKLFRSWPEFKQSSFVSCMDTFLLRLDEHVAFDTDSENLEEMFQFSLDETQLPLE